MHFVSQLLHPISKEFIAGVEMQYFPHDSVCGLFRLCTLVCFAANGNGANVNFLVPQILQSVVGHFILYYYYCYCFWLLFLTSLFFQRLLEARPDPLRSSKEQPLWTAGAELFAWPMCNQQCQSAEGIHYMP